MCLNLTLGGCCNHRTCSACTPLAEGVMGRRRGTKKAGAGTPQPRAYASERPPGREEVCLITEEHRRVCETPNGCNKIIQPESKCFCMSLFIKNTDSLLGEGTVILIKADFKPYRGKGGIFWFRCACVQDETPIPLAAPPPLVAILMPQKCAPHFHQRQWAEFHGAAERSAR